MTHENDVVVFAGVVKKSLKTMGHQCCFEHLKRCDLLPLVCFGSLGLEEWSGLAEGNQATVHSWEMTCFLFMCVHSMASCCKLFLRKQFVPQIRGCNYAEAVLQRFDVANRAGVEEDQKRVSVCHVSSW